MMDQCHRACLGSSALILRPARGRSGHVRGVTRPCLRTTGPPMTERRSDDNQRSPTRSRPQLDPTHPAWFAHQAALALLTRYTTVAGYSALLHRVVARPPWDPARLDHYTHALQREVNDLGRLLEQYLEAVQLQAGLVTLLRRPVGLPELLEAVQASCADLSEWTARHALVIEQAETISGHWDPHWVALALSAVVSNAMKFTPDGGTIQLQVQRQDDTAIVTVRDPGLGIRADERERIVLPFVRGAAAQAGIPGWGLGLYLADQAVQAHAGAIELRGAPSAGSTVTIRLPLQPVA